MYLQVMQNRNTYQYFLSQDQSERCTNEEKVNQYVNVVIVQFGETFEFHYTNWWQLICNQSISDEGQLKEWVIYITSYHLLVRQISNQPL